MKRQKFEAGIHVQELFPKIVPGLREEDFLHHDHQPMEESSIAPTAADVFDTVDEAAEASPTSVWRARLHEIGCERDPTTVMKPVVKEGRYGLLEILDIGSCFRIAFWSQGVKELLKAPTGP